MDVSQSREPDLLDQPVSVLAGVGPERSALLEKLEIRCVRDLLLHPPRRYEDRRHFTPFAQLQPGASVAACGKVVAMGTKYFGKRTKSVFELILDDGTARLHCHWWNLRFSMEKNFKVGDEVVLFGKVIKLKPRTINHPETEVVDSGLDERVHGGRIVPVYPLTEGLSQRWLRGLVWRTLETIVASSQGAATPLTPSASANSTPRPAHGLQSLSHAAFKEVLLPGPEITNGPAPGSAIPPLIQSLSYAQAVCLMHVPLTPEDSSRARRRIAFEEFLAFQLELQGRRLNFQKNARALPCKGTNNLIRPLLQQLGFKLTAAQTKVLREIRADMAGGHPMRRLLQGDVGSGKTLVAFCTALMSIESGFSVALMAPTEILAEQHFRTANKWLAKIGVQTHLITGSSDTRMPVKQCPPGPVLYIGTHALLEPHFAPARLGLVIIDEQHKFGVSQREELLRKGNFPHLLVMTATPIPRTLGLALYGDLDSSTIDELPPGRGSIRTYIRPSKSLQKVWDFVKSQLTSGRQAYVLYPRIEETAGNVKAVTKEFEQVQKALAPYTLAMLHGRVSSAEKERVMSGFVANRVNALLATSLIEVGVDVPNASVMVIENAEQFGLAQLHQLRGRIGRGAHESYCVLVHGGGEAEKIDRLKVLEKCIDGFEIAEADLALRGPGDFLGQDQSGAPRFRFGDLTRDLELLQEAKTRALGLLQNRPGSAPPGAGSSALPAPRATAL